MISDSGLYSNVDNDDIEVKNQSLRDIYNSPSRRVILEAMLLDTTTPTVLFADLFGLLQDEVEDYRTKYFFIPKKPARIDLWEYIENLPVTTDIEISRKKLFQEVFYDGWEAIDKKFNRSSCLDLKEYGKKIFKEVSTRVKQNVDSMLKESNEALNMSQLKTAMSILKDGIKLFDEETSGNSASEQLILDFVHDVQKSSKENFSYVPINAINVNQYGIPETTIEKERESEYQEMMKDIKSVASTKNTKDLDN